MKKSNIEITENIQNKLFKRFKILTKTSSQINELQMLHWFMIIYTEYTLFFLHACI